MTLVQQSQGIDSFFHNLFSFMRRKTDFYTHEDKAQEIVSGPLVQHMKLFKEDKQREAALKKKQEEEKTKKAAEEAAAKRNQGESTATVEEVTDEEAERIMKEE